MSPSLRINFVAFLPVSVRTLPLIENSFYLNGDKQEGYNVIIHKDLNVNIRPDNIEDENISSEITLELEDR